MQPDCIRQSHFKNVVFHKAENHAVVKKNKMVLCHDMGSSPKMNY